MAVIDSSGTIVSATPSEQMAHGYRVGGNINEWSSNRYSRPATPEEIARHQFEMQMQTTSSPVQARAIQTQNPSSLVPEAEKRMIFSESAEPYGVGTGTQIYTSAKGRTVVRTEARTLDNAPAGFGSSMAYQWDMRRAERNIPSEKVKEFGFFGKKIEVKPTKETVDAVRVKQYEIDASQRGYVKNIKSEIAPVQQQVTAERQAELDISRANAQKRLEAEVEQLTKQALSSGWDKKYYEQRTKQATESVNTQFMSEQERINTKYADIYAQKAGEINTTYQTKWQKEVVESGKSNVQLEYQKFYEVGTVGKINNAVFKPIGSAYSFVNEPLTKGGTYKFMPPYEDIKNLQAQGNKIVDTKITDRLEKYGNQLEPNLGTNIADVYKTQREFGQGFTTKWYDDVRENPTMLVATLGLSYGLKMAGWGASTAVSMIPSKAWQTGLTTVGTGLKWAGIAGLGGVALLGGGLTAMNIASLPSYKEQARASGEFLGSMATYGIVAYAGSAGATKTIQALQTWYNKPHLIYSSDKGFSETYKISDKQKLEITQQLEEHNAQVHREIITTQNDQLPRGISSSESQSVWKIGKKYVVADVKGGGSFSFQDQAGRTISATDKFNIKFSYLNSDKPFKYPDGTIIQTEYRYSRPEMKYLSARKGETLTYLKGEGDTYLASGTSYRGVITEGGLPPRSITVSQGKVLEGFTGRYALREGNVIKYSGDITKLKIADVLTGKEKISSVLDIKGGYESSTIGYEPPKLLSTNQKVVNDLVSTNEQWLSQITKINSVSEYTVKPLQNLAVKKLLLGIATFPVTGTVAVSPIASSVSYTSKGLPEIGTSFVTGTQLTKFLDLKVGTQLLGAVLSKAGVVESVSVTPALAGGSVRLLQGLGYSSKLQADTFFAVKPDVGAFSFPKVLSPSATIPISTTIPDIGSMPKIGTEAGTIPAVDVKPYVPVPVPFTPKAIDIPFTPFIFPRMSGGGGAGAPSNQKYTYSYQKNRWVGDYSKLLSAVGARLYTPKTFKYTTPKLTFGRPAKKSKEYTSLLSGAGLPKYKKPKNTIFKGTKVFNNKKIKIKLR